MGAYPNSNAIFRLSKNVQRPVIRGEPTNLLYIIRDNRSVVVEYNGTAYERDSRGKYRCPNRCGHPDWPQPSWSSDKGFLGHLAKCKGADTWRPEPVTEREKFADCPDCSAVIWKLSSCWRMREKIVCLNCYLPYFEAGYGHLDSAGLELSIFTLEV